MAISENIQKPVCFVIGPIGQNGTETRKHADMMLHCVIKHVVEGVDFKYHCKRADEDARPGMINDQIILDIVNSDLVVADLSELNPNAFYELGIRHSTLKPTIHIASHSTKLPFDNSGHSTIFVDLTDWNSILSARSRLESAILEIRKDTYRVSKPLTQAKSTFAMTVSEDPRDKILLNMQNDINDLKATIQNSMEYNENFIDNDDLEAMHVENSAVGKVFVKIKEGIDNKRGAKVMEITAKSFAKACGLNVQNIKIKEDVAEIYLANGNNYYFKLH